MRGQVEHPLVDQVDDVGLAVRGQLGEQALGQHQRRSQIDRHVPPPALAIGGLGPVVVEDRGVVDQQRERPERGGGRADQPAVARSSARSAASATARRPRPSIAATTPALPPAEVR